MMTSGDARWWQANINTFVGLAFVAAFSFAMLLIVWKAAYNKNPFADFLATSLYTQQP